MPVTMLRQTDGKLRRDGSSAAAVQPQYPVDERGRLHGASELKARTRDRIPENRFVYYRNQEEERRCRQYPVKHNRLRRQDKRGHRGRRLGYCFYWEFCGLPQRAGISRTVQAEPNTLDFLIFPHVAAFYHIR